MQYLQRLMSSQSRQSPRQSFRLRLPLQSLDLELSVSQDEAIAKSDGIALEPESDSPHSFRPSP